MKAIDTKLSRISTILILLIFIFTTSASAQVANIDIGNLHLKWDESGSFFGEYQDPIGYWPAGWYRSAFIEEVAPWAAITHLEAYANGNDASEGIDVYDMLSEWVTDIGYPVESIREIRRVTPPTVTVDNVPSRPYAGEVDPDLPADLIVETVNKGNMDLGGCRFKLRIYAFENPEFDDFLIFDYTIKFLLDWDRDDPDPDGPDQSIETWFGMHWNLQPCWYGRDEYERDFYNSDEFNSYMIRESELVTPGSTPRDSLLISYACDCNDPMWETGDDYGDPDRETGALLTPQFIGFATLNASSSVDDDTDDPTKPINHLTIDLDTEIWCDVWPHDDNGYDWATSVGCDESRVGENPWTPYGGLTESEIGNLMLQFHGPYNMDIGDSIRYVFALGAGSIDPVYALELGEDWKAGLVDTLTKDSILWTGNDSLFNTIDKAYWAWINYLNTGDFGIPLAPPAPDLEVTSGPGYNYLSWSYPDPGMIPVDFQEWRIYHKRGHYLVNHPDDIPFQNYELIYTTSDINETSYTDTVVVRGQPYHYIVTALNTGGVESSKFANRTLYGATPFEAGLSTVDSVRIVPNPYNISARALNFAEPNKISFFGLPPYCTLKIYNEFGDLVKVIEHTTGSGDESWEQITESNQYIASGVYILSVRGAKDIDQNPLPTSDKDCIFVIIR